MLDRSEIPILVVDDDSELLSMTLGVLRQAGFKRISQAASVKHAQETLFATGEPSPTSKTLVMDDCSIVLLDVMLPDGSGFDFCKELKLRNPNCMVLMMSGFDIESLNEKLVDCEADDFLTKPFNSLELVARIELLAAKMKRQALRSVSAASIDRSAPAGNRIPHVGDCIGDYMILDALGWGKNSVIYKAVKRKGGTESVAIKLLTKYSMEFREVVRRFDIERRLMSRICHPNLIKFIEAGVWDGCPFIVMEHVGGVNLEERLVANGPPDAALALSGAMQVASGLCALHKLGALHRDIKLKNILYDAESGVFKLMDFGIAKLMDGAEGVTTEGFIVGTPLYMAPEVFRGESATVKSDIYSFGASFYHFASGTPPFSAKRNADIYQKHLSENPRPIRALNPGMPKAFDVLISERCMAKSPNDRPDSMDEVLAALQKIKL